MTDDTTLKAHTLFNTGYFINGQWHTSDTTFDVDNPATGEMLARVAKAGKTETDAAIAAAVKAFPAWRAKTAKKRSEVLYRWYQLIMENQAYLAKLMSAEQAKRVNGEIIPPAKAHSRIFATREPVGMVAAITPWNFPLAMLTRKLGPALAAGCTALIKPANATPLSAFALLALAQQAGVPDGVLNGVAGDTQAISDAIMASGTVRKVTFTGSTEVGKTLMRNAAGTMKKISMELGGNAPYIVFDDADIPAAVAGAMANKFRNAGQVCVSVNRFFIQDGVYDRFVAQLAQEVEKLKVGNGADEGVVVGPLINRAGVEKAEGHVNDALKKGARVVTGGKRHPLGGNFFQPTVLADVTDDMQLAREETFGPVAACFRFADEEEAIRRANDTPYGLAAYFYTRDLARVFRVAASLESGMIGINECAVSTELGPFGGVKESGLGREGSVLGMEDYLEVKTLHIGGL
ncbi:NAD-dependent succinate-semialdehyde dehydrogenase [Sodalis sp.]|uniref:NAD-dependent succinate-semialdehyde dehydrogenase n=1 Tax=Sodalis sp. (in: enterobacteria) TaxID=1898979 RepID=UPI003872B83F